MALPCPGPAPISLLDIQNEFGGTYATQIIEYYRGGSYVKDNATNIKIPTSGQISFSDFFCGSGEIVIEIGDSTYVDVRKLFGNAAWYSTFKKRLIVKSGATIGPSVSYGLPATNASGYAMLIFNDFAGEFTLENKGSIQGAGGRYGGSTILSGEERTNQYYGGNGGNAIFIGDGGTAPQKVNINNLGTIYGGGGGGGAAANSAGSSATANYSFVSGQVTISLTSNNPTFGGGLGQGYKQTKTVSSGALTASYEITFKNNGWANHKLAFPPKSKVNLDIQSAYTREMYFGYNSNVYVNLKSSGVGNIGSDGCIYLYPNIKTTYCGFNFAGKGLGGMYVNGTNSIVNVAFNGSSGCYQLTKDPNQAVNGSYGPSNLNEFNDFYAVINQTGGGPATPDNYISLSGNWGFLDTYMPTPILIGSTTPGAGGDWGQSGNSSTDGNLGGNGGSAIVNGQYYANYINVGTIVGSVA